ncbi:MAG: cystathionine beta-lyase [Pigmentiphaga sp.]
MPPSEVESAVVHPLTRLVHAGRDPSRQGGAVNMPVYRASTICFPDMASLEHARANPDSEISYGIYGTPTVRAFQDAMAELEGGHRALALPSGLAAISAAVLSFARAGDHLLMVDTVYGPTRRFCDAIEARLGIGVTYYDPRDPDPGRLLQANTRLIYAESPGSQTFEIQDIPALAGIAHRAGIPLLLDNSWGTPLHFPAFAHGVDVSIHAATKYISGHSDVMMGLVVCNAASWTAVREQVVTHGLCVSPDDCYLALRGLRTLAPRLERQVANALQVARWLQEQAAVRQVLYPVLPESPDHALWKRDFRGGASLFAIELDTRSEAAVRALVEGTKVFALGASWGGYESLIFPAYPGPERRVAPWKGGQLVRLHIGLEDPRDLIADLAAGLARAAAHPEFGGTF